MPCPLRVWRAETVPRQFHPTFAAAWRRYVYLLPLRAPQQPPSEPPGERRGSVMQPEAAALNPLSV
jgi:tRNA U38,U39,U40 pseudouridine synthase TruA